MVVVEVAGIPLEINIVGNDGPFPEYDDPDACETSPVGSKKTKNVESRADTSFAVRFSLGETPTKTGLDFETDLELDGKKVEELVFSEQDLVLGSMKVDSYIAFQNGKSVEQKFFFRKLPVVDVDNDNVTQTNVQSLGTIKIKMYPGKLGEAVASSTRLPCYFEGAIVSEEMLKGDARSQQVQLGSTTELCGERTEMYTFERCSEMPCAIVEFKYRSEDDLRMLHVKARPNVLSGKRKERSPTIEGSPRGNAQAKRRRSSETIILIEDD